jgi:hypothetical protein
MSAQSLAALERLALETSKRIEDGSERPDADPLYSAQHGVEPSAHVIRLNLADEGIELRGRWADAEEQRNLDEDDEEGRHSVDVVNGG